MIKKIIAGVILIIIVVALGSILSSEGNKTIKIGVISVLSGDKASIGESFKKGIELARDEYIKKYPDAKVELIFEDDAYDGQKGLEALNRLIKDKGIQAVITATSPTITTISSSTHASIPILSYGTETNGEIKDTIFHLFPSPLFADVALGALMKSLNPKVSEGVIGVYTNDPILVKFYGAFQEAVGEDIAEFNLDPGMSDMKAVVKKVIEKKPKYIFMTNYPDIGAQFIKELKGLSGGTIKQTLVFDLTLNETLAQYQEILGDLKFLDGSIVVNTQKVEDIDKYGYDAFNILLETYNKSSSQWVSNIQNAQMKGVTGDTRFDSVGRRIPTFSIGSLKDGLIR